jgi:hypothetical protein
MEVAGEDAPGEVVEPLPPSPTVAGTRKMRRLRKVRETEIKESETVDEVGVVSEKRSDVKGHQETAEEILKRFGKGEDGGKKRKAVQSTIMAAVVDMAKQMKAVPVQEEEVTNVGNVEAEDCGQELQSQGEELVAGSEGDILRCLCGLALEKFRGVDVGLVLIVR